MRSEGVAILAAVAFHGAVLLVARGMPPLALLLPPDRTEAQRPTEYEVEPALVAEAREPIISAPPDQVSPDRPQDPVRAPDRPASRTAPNLPNPQGPSTSEPVAPGNPPPGNAPPDGTGKPKWDDLPPDGMIGVPGNPGGPPIWAMPGVIPTTTGGAPPAPTTTPAVRPVDSDVAGRVLREVMSTHDKGLGLDLPAAGNVSSAVAAAVQSSEVPNDAKGTIEIRLGPTGNVLSVRMLSSRGGTAGQWARVVAAVQAALAGRGLAMIGAYEKGATVTVSAVSNLQAPSGSKGGFQGSGVAFDTANIGAHSTRHVRTSYSVSPAP